MTASDYKKLRLSDNDLDFLVETVSPDVRDKKRLKEILRDDEDFKKSFICHEKVYQAILFDDEIFIKISPTLFFEILLRKVIILCLMPLSQGDCM